MATAIQRLVSLAVVFSMVACTSLQQLPEREVENAGKAQRQALNIAIGEMVRIVPKNGDPFQMVVTSVNTESIVGDRGGTNNEVPLASIESIEQRRFDTLRTTLLLVGLGLIALGQFAKGLSKLTNP